MWSSAPVSQSGEKYPHQEHLMQYAKEGDMTQVEKLILVRLQC